MKRPAVERFRQRLKAGEAVYGCWVTLEAAAVSEIAVGLGFDWIAVDADHGRLDWAELSEHVRAAVHSETVVLIKLNEPGESNIERAMNIGADGVMMANVKTAEETKELNSRMRQAAAFEQFASKLPGFSSSGRNPLMVLTLEAPRCKELADSGLLDAADVDAFFVSLPVHSAACLASLDEAVDEHCRNTVRQRGSAMGAMVSDERLVSKLGDRGFRMLCLGVDSGIIFDELDASLQAARG